MVTFRLHQLKLVRSDWGNIRIVCIVTASPFKVSFPIRFLPILVWYLILMVAAVFLIISSVAAMFDPLRLPLP
jgi:hypothetical protein